MIFLQNDTMDHRNLRIDKIHFLASYSSLDHKKYSKMIFNFSLVIWKRDKKNFGSYSFKRHFTIYLFIFLTCFDYFVIWMVAIQQLHKLKV